jgi:hypothetical protein
LFLHARLRVHRAPGIPCALRLFRGTLVSASLGRFQVARKRSHALHCHAPRRRGIQYSRGVSVEHCRLWNTGSPDQVGRRHRMRCLKVESEVAKAALVELPPTLASASRRPSLPTASRGRDQTEHAARSRERTYFLLRALFAAASTTLSTSSRQRKISIASTGWLNPFSTRSSSGLASTHCSTAP